MVISYTNTRCRLPTLPKSFHFTTNSMSFFSSFSLSSHSSFPFYNLLNSINVSHTCQSLGSLLDHGQPTKGHTTKVNRVFFLSCQKLLIVHQIGRCGPPESLFSCAELLSRLSLCSFMLTTTVFVCSWVYQAIHVPKTLLFHNLLWPLNPRVLQFLFWQCSLSLSDKEVWYRYWY